MCVCFHFHTDEYNFDKKLISRQCKFIKKNTYIYIRKDV